MRRPVKPSSPRRGYHHGDLPATLTDTAVELITERGLEGFSLAEAARRAGVSVAAPYRHFPDKESLLAAVAVRAYRHLGPILDHTIGTHTDPVDKLAAAAGAYVRFSAAEPALFTAMFRAGVTKSRFPDLLAASRDTYSSWLDAARELTTDDAAATELGLDVLTIAHGHAALLADHQLGAPEEHVAESERRVRRVVTTFLSAAARRSSDGSSDDRR